MAVLPAAPAALAEPIPSRGVAGILLIVEVMYDPAAGGADPAGEWLIVRNTSTQAMQLRGWRLRDSQAESLLPVLDVPGGGQVLIAAADVMPDLQIPGVGQRVTLAGRIGNGLRNTGDSLALLDGFGLVVDALSWGDDQTVLAPAVPAALPGQSLRRYASMDSDTARDWIAPAHAAPRNDPPAAALVAPAAPAATMTTSPTGTAGGSQAAVLAPATATPLAASQGGGPDSVAVREQVERVAIVLSEVAPHDGWIELYNRGDEPVDLRGWSLADGAGTNTLQLPDQPPIAAHGFALIPATTFKLAQRERSLVLRRPDGSTADRITIRPLEPGRSWSRYPVHGGEWTPNTPLTAGAFNLLDAAPPPPEPDAEAGVAEARPESSPVDNRRLLVPILGLALLVMLLGGVLVRRWSSP